MNLRQGAIVVGIVAFTLAIGVLGNVLSIGLGSWAIIFVGVVALLIALNTLTRRHGVHERGTTPDPEHRYRVPTPGAELTEAVDQFRSRRGDLFAPSNRIQDGLREAAIATLTRFQGLTPSAADERIEDGSWTDDPYAAAFLSPTIDPPERPLRERLTARFVRDVSFRDGVRRTAAAVAAVGYTGLEADDRRDSRLATYERDTTTENEPVPRTTRTSVDGVVERASRRTGHWVGIGVVALIAISIGAFAESSAIVMAGAVGIAYAGFAHAMEAPTPDIDIERTLSEETPEPGDEIDVEVTITNESNRFLPDLRLVDGVPAGLAVTDEGTARLGTALRPDESVTLEYTVTARRGRHVFDPALAFTRDLSRSSEKEFLVGSSTSITCEPVLRPITTSVPLRATAATFSGRLTTPEGGSGTQFHSVREYRKNDPLNRIDWNRHARTGELATLEFHEERAARVLVLVDARKANYLAPEPDAAHAVDRSVAAAGRIAATLLQDGDTVGLAAIGPLDKREEGEDDDEDVEQCWLGPSSGHHHRAQFQQLLATHPQFSTLSPPKSRRWTPQLQRIYRRLSSDTQIILLTPLCDRVSSDIVRWLDARGYAVTVVSPDPTTDRTTGNQLARVARRIRRFDLQRAGVPVVDWPADQSIDEAFARINAGSGVSSSSASTAGSTAGTDSRADAGATTGASSGGGWSGSSGGGGGEAQ